MTDYMRYMELSLLDESSDEEQEIDCSCSFPRKDYATLQLTPNVVVQPEMLRKIVLKIFCKENDEPGYFQPTKYCPSNVLLVIIDSKVPESKLRCAKHHFQLSLGNFLRESKVDIFFEEFFCDRRRTRVNHADDGNFTKRRRRGTPHECSVKDLLIKSQNFQAYGIQTTGPLIRTKVRPATIAAEWRSVLAIFCCAAENVLGELALTRVTIANVNNSEIIFDEFVKQPDEVVSFRTKDTGITREDIQRAKRTHKQILLELLEKFIYADTILVGQNIGCDLRVLGIHHTRVVDINNIYPRKEDVGENSGYSLKLLSATVLNRPIAMRFVDAVENTLAIADLLREKMRNGIAFGVDLKIVEAPAASGNPLLNQLVSQGVEVLLHKDSERSSTKIWLQNVEHRILRDGPHMQRYLSQKDEKVFTISHMKEFPTGMSPQKLAAEIQMRQGSKSPLTIMVVIGEENHTVFFA